MKFHYIPSIHMSHDDMPILLLPPCQQKEVLLELQKQGHEIWISEQDEDGWPAWPPKVLRVMVKEK